jgi:hypothetical protein
MATDAEKRADAERMTNTGPEASGQKSAATLEEAMAMQDQMAREANGTTAEDSADALAAKNEETNAAIEEAGKAQEARDDEVYGRVAGAEDRRPGVGETVPSAQETALAEESESKATSKSQSKSKGY